MNNEALNEALKIANELSDKMDSLLKLQKVAFSQLPPEYRENIKHIENDIALMNKAFKKGDEKIVNEMMNKYAGINKER